MAVGFTPRIMKSKGKGKTLALWWKLMVKVFMVE